MGTASTKRKAGLGAAVVAAGLALGAVLMRPPPPLPAPPRGADLKGVTVIQPLGGRQAMHRVVVKDSVIASIQPSPQAQGPYAGMYALPGLIDLHVHHPPQRIPVPRDLYPLLHLLHGVTTVRDVGDIDGDAVVALGALLGQGAFPGPRLFACGPFVDGEHPTWPNAMVVTDAASAANAVHAIAAEGYDCIKVYSSLSADALAAVLEEAKRAGLPVLGHVPHAVAYPGGIAEVQHFSGAPTFPNADPTPYPDYLEGWRRVDDAQLDRLVDAIVATGTANTPTLAVTFQYGALADYPALVVSPVAALLPRFFSGVLWNPTAGLPRDTRPSTLANVAHAVTVQQRLIKRLYDAGATVHLGTDTLTPFVVPGASMHLEMRLMAQAGLTAEQVWALATWGNARALKLPGLGRLEMGAPADMLLFAKDPTIDLANLDTLEAVVADGRLYTRADLAHRHARLMKHFNGGWVDRILTAFTSLAVRVMRWKAGV